MPLLNGGRYQRGASIRRWADRWMREKTYAKEKNIYSTEKMLLLIAIGSCLIEESGRETLLDESEPFGGPRRPVGNRSKYMEPNTLGLKVGDGGASRGAIQLSSASPARRWRCAEARDLRSMSE